MIKNPTYQSLVLSLTELFVGKRPNPEIIGHAMEAISQIFSFDGALIYEIDQDNYLNLKERWLRETVPLLERFAIEEILPESFSRMAAETVSCISGGGKFQAGEMLTLFGVKSLVLYSVVDEKNRIYGLLAFLNNQDKNLPQGDDLHALTVLLSMLGRYAGVRMYQNKADFAERSLESVLDNTGIDIYVNDFYNHDILYVNKSMAAPYGGISQFEGQKCWKVLYPGQTEPCEFCPQKKLIDEDGNPTKVYSWDYQRPFDGSWFRVFSAAFRWVDGRLAHVVSSADITDNKRNEALIQYMANYDALTNLPNRRKLIGELERLIDSVKEGRKQYLLFFDIDGFKRINDVYGHDAGDEFLVMLGEFFSGIPLLKNSIYRNGGDEFIAILGGGVTETTIRDLAGYIHERFHRPWDLKKASVYCNTSIGAACYPEDGETAEELLQKADQAMYVVKKAGGGGISFTHELNR